MTTNRRVAVPALDDLRAFVARLSATHVVAVEGLSGVSVEKLLRLKALGWDFLDVRDPVVIAAGQAYLKQALRNAEKKPGAVVDVFAHVARGMHAQLLMRWRKGYGRPLKPTTVAHKRRMGYQNPTLQGVAEGHLYRNVERAKLTLVKVSG